MSITVRSAKKSESAELDVLMQAYLAELAQFSRDLQPDEDGRYQYPYLPAYWQDPNRYPFLFRVKDTLAGFALCRFDIDPVNGQRYMELAEFYITPDFRRQRLGQKAANALWELFPGYWEVRVMAANTPALPFWQQAITSYTGGKFSEQEKQELIGRWHVFRFESVPGFELPDDYEPDVVDY